MTSKPFIEDQELRTRIEALDAALCLNRSYIGNRKEWQSMPQIISASDVVDDAEIFYQFLKG